VKTSSSSEKKMVASAQLTTKTATTPSYMKSIGNNSKKFGEIKEESSTSMEKRRFTQT
jgi:hypothetical protein